MKKHLGLIGVLFILVIVGLCGCTQQETLPNQSIDIPPTTESLQAILSKAETIESMYYEIDASIDISEFGTQTASIKIWYKKPYLKEQITSSTSGITSTTTIIHRPEGTYLYDTTQETYVLTTQDSSFATSLQYLDSKTIKNFLMNQTDIDFETDIVDAKKATVFNYTLPLEGDSFITIKLWIWNDNGVPLQAYMDMTMETISMSMDFQFRNYSFADIPDSTFNVS